MRKSVIIWLTFIGGLYYFCEYFFPEESGTREFIPVIGKLALVIGSFAFGLGTVNLLKAHFGRIMRLRPGYHNSIALALGLFIMAFSQIWLFYFGRYGGEPGTTFAFFFETQRILFKSILQGLNATIFSLLAFFMASAAYRAFRIKSLEAGIMMVVAIIVMLGQIPLGTEIFTKFIPADHFFAFLKFEELRGWIMDFWNTAAQRGILFGSYIGMLAMTLRIWLSLESGSFFDDV
jgi:hypothetical protein